MRVKSRLGRTTGNAVDPALAEARIDNPCFFIRDTAISDSVGRHILNSIYASINALPSWKIIIGMVIARFVYADTFNFKVQLKMA